VKVGDFVIRKEFMDKDHVCGIVIDFDCDGDPIVYWNGGSIEEEFLSNVEVTSESR